MQQHTLEIYKASAGSGKTFLLTLKYLGLILSEPGMYQRILAVTFTNKATAEMKHRILSELQYLAAGKETITGKILLEAGTADSFTELQQKAKLVYGNLLHDYSRFSVSTIDAFVQRIIRSFAWEIGIDGSFQLQLSTDSVKEDLATRLYKRLDNDSALKDWMVEMAKERLKNDQRWDFKDDLLKLSGELFNESFQKFEKAFNNLTEEEIGEAFDKLKSTVYQHVKAFNTKWQRTGILMLELLSRNGLEKEDFHYGKGGFINYFFKAANEEIEKPGTRVNEALKADAAIANKKIRPDKKAAINSIQNEIIQALQQLCNWYEQEITDYNTAKAIKRNIGLLRLMRVFAQELKHYRSENNALLISDTHLLLRQLTEDTSAAFIYEKTGNRYRHFLIDEFQDTSQFQWSNFKPLFENAMSEGHYNLIVGDVKQAIYRWRNGDWRLLLKTVKKQLQHFPVSEHSLTDNRRSAAQIIEFNNYLFHTAPHIVQHIFTHELQNADTPGTKALLAEGYDEIFTAAYADTLQQIPENTINNGYVEINWLSNQNEADEEEEELQTYDTIVLEKMFLKIEELLQNGFSPADLAILTRSNAEAKKVVEYLLLQQQFAQIKYSIISGEALLLGANQGIQILISALKILINENDHIALAQLRLLMLLQNGHDANNLEVYASSGNINMLPPTFMANRHKLIQLPLTELINRLIIDFDLSNKTLHSPYLLAFQDLIMDWVKKGEAGLDVFLNFWEEERLKKALVSGSNTNAIEVLTIHKSKGLAFTVLLMPFLNWSIKPSGYNAPILWVETNSTRFNNIPIVPVKYSELVATSHFSKSYFEEKLMSVMDNLNLLYVAFTRARQRIYGWAPLSKKSSEQTNNIGDILFKVAAQIDYQIPNNLPNTILDFDKEKYCWKYGELVIPPTVKDRPVDIAILDSVYSNWRDHLQLRYKPLQLNTTMPLQLPRTQGVLLHEVLARLQEPNDLELVLGQLKLDGIITTNDYNNLYQVLSETLAQAMFSHWADGTMQRMGERNIITKQGELRRPDLVLFNAKETCIIDFKFTEQETEIGKYYKQVADYMSVFKALNFPQIKGHIVYPFLQKTTAVFI